MPDIKSIAITARLVMQIAELEEFKGGWTVFARLRPEQPKALKKNFTIESSGSSKNQND